MIRIEHLFLKYHGADDYTLADCSLTVNAGEMVLISGPTGSGKSTLINCLNGILQHESAALLEGTVLFDDVDLKSMPLMDICRLTGTVFQNPNSQICTAMVETEIAFGLENIQTDVEEMHRRIDEALILTNLEQCRYQRTETLSGGQKQRLMIACALAQKPKLLLLDEPLSQLDPMGTREILEVISTLKNEGNIAVILVEHRIEDTLYLSDRLVIMNQGKIVQDTTRDKAVYNLDCMRQLGLTIPHLPDLFEQLGHSERPLSADKAPLIKVDQMRPPLRKKNGKLICELQEISFRYDKKEAFILNGLSASFFKGECIALMGSNGTGKSTLLHLMAGQYKTEKGVIHWTNNRPPVIGMLLQAPDLMLFCDSVKDEIEFAPIHQKKSREELDRIAKTIVEQMGLETIQDQAPFSLSVGQRLRTALASILSMQPAVLLLDEPTSGQDGQQIGKMMGSIKDMFDLVVFGTHCIDTAAKYADRVFLIEEGKVSAFGTPEEVFFNEKIINTTPMLQSGIQRYSSRLGIQALTVDQVLECRP